ncbi:MAG: hypothetical protein IPH09_05065 [bacterium]|nr:hypothetical protein [bacterium]
MPLSSSLHKAVWRTEGTISFTHCLSIATHRELKLLGDHIVGGQLGDIGSGGHIFPYALMPRPRDRFVAATARRYLRYAPRSLLPLFTPDFVARVYPDLVTAFTDSFADLPSLPNHRLYESWDLQERQPHQTLASTLIDSHLFGHVFPFLDRECLSFALSLPTRLRFGQPLYKAMIHRLGPEIRHVPNANNNLVLRGSVAGNLGSKLYELSAKAGRRLTARTVGRRHAGPAPAPSADMALLTRRDPGFRRIIAEFAQSPSCDDAIFDRAGIRRMLDEHQSGAADHADLLCTLATVAVGIHYFVDGARTACPTRPRPLPGGPAATGDPQP